MKNAKPKAVIIAAQQADSARVEWDARANAPAANSNAKAKKPPRKKQDSLNGILKTRAPLALPAPIQQQALARPAPITLVPKPQKLDSLGKLTVFVAVVLAVIAAYFSVSGMTRIFPGASTQIMVMASVMEAGKLAGAGWLSAHWHGMRWWVRVSLVLLVTILASTNALGVFGQLSAAHLDPHVASVAETALAGASVKAQIESQMEIVSGIKIQIHQIDDAVDVATRRGKAGASMELAAKKGNERMDLVMKLERANQKLGSLEVEQAKIVNNEQRAAADIGVLQYAADIFGIDRERMIQILIAMMVLTCDPLSIMLVVATAHRK